MASPSEIEQLRSIGEKLGLEKGELRQFVEDERARLKAERDEERRLRREEREKKAEEEEKRIEGEKELLQLKQQQEKELIEMKLKLAQVSGTQGADTSHIKKVPTPKLPPFDEEKDDMDAYINRFERYATVQGWKRDTEWAIGLGALLKGKALIEYSRLTPAEAADYDKVKKAALEAYHLTARGFRRRFKDSRPTQGETGLKFANRITTYLKRWLEASKVSNFDALFDLLLREQFLEACGRDLRIFLKERDPDSIKVMVEHADHYIIAHGGWYPNQSKGKSSRLNGNRVGQVDSQRRGGSHQNVGRGRGATGYGSSRGRGQRGREFGRGGARLNEGNRGDLQKTCFICNSPKHFAKDCPTRPALASMVSALNSGGAQQATESATKANENKGEQANLSLNCIQVSQPIMEWSGAGIEPAQECRCDYEDRNYTQMEDGNCMKEVGKKCLRSAACGTARRDRLPRVKGKVGDKEVEVLWDTGCDGIVVKTALVKEEQFTGQVTECSLLDNTRRYFRMAHIDIDTPYLSGRVCAVCVDNPVSELIIGDVEGTKKPDQVEIEESQPEVVPVIAVQTRSQAKGAKKATKPLKVLKTPEDFVDREVLEKEQAEDKSLDKIRDLVETGEEKESKSGSRHKYILDDRILVREFTSPSVNFGETLRQVVVPAKLRGQVLKLAHSALFGGHLGVQKTKDKVLSNFTWPGIHGDVTRYCQSCDVCQRSVQKGRTTKVPLGSLPIMGEPFQRVAADLVGPITPATERGHKYILVLVDYATRYPEAIPLKNIMAETVAEGLLTVYSRVGFPKESQTQLI
ncbi:Protein NYNRIN [Holothuria leucospilota]|uniref:Protein NYNRIN n=1 Tax=Holothuria leucospilota TaxID=206669 RepID=A0A9Q1C1Y2_HOLLE|nr:Protein NYNRIN [Holothuria leucospilota]